MSDEAFTDQSNLSQKSNTDNAICRGFLIDDLVQWSDACVWLGSDLCLEAYDLLL